MYTKGNKNNSLKKKINRTQKIGIQETRNKML